MLNHIKQLNRIVLDLFKVNLASAQEHVPEAERNNRTISEGQTSLKITSKKGKLLFNSAWTAGVDYTESKCKSKEEGKEETEETKDEMSDTDMEDDDEESETSEEEEENEDQRDINEEENEDQRDINEVTYDQDDHENQDPV